MEKYKEMLATLAKTSAEIESTKRSYKELNLKEYIDDIPAHIEKMKEAYTALQSTYKEFDGAMHKYNELCKGEIETIPYYLNTVWDMKGIY